jgi:OmpA-OmpF porin, OOP family
MKRTSMTLGVFALGLLATGCATKKYVVKSVSQSVAPVEQRVTSAEGKNGEQDKQIAGQGSEIENLDRNLSQTKEKLGDTDSKAVQAGEAAKAADQKAGNAQQAADGARLAADDARRAADDAHSFAEQGLNSLNQTVQSMNTLQMLKTESVLFGFDTDKLTTDGKTQLDDLANQVNGMDRYVIEVQGFTDKTGDAVYNESLSQRRAQAVARYLANQHQIPVRSISMLGSGYAQPVANDRTREGRKMNRRVEVRLWVPESQSKKTAAADQQQQ